MAMGSIPRKPKLLTPNLTFLPLLLWERVGVRGVFGAHTKGPLLRHPILKKPDDSRIEALKSLAI
jgi:hypothetical protein